MDYSHHLLRRCEAPEHFLAYGALAHFLNEALDNLEVDVGFEQGASHLFHCIIYVRLVESPLPAQASEGSVQAVGKALKHLCTPATQYHLLIGVNYSSRIPDPR